VTDAAAALHKVRTIVEALPARLPEEAH